jgi:hypothetical protein
MKLTFTLEANEKETAVLMDALTTFCATLAKTAGSSKASCCDTGPDGWVDYSVDNNSDWYRPSMESEPASPAPPKAEASPSPLKAGASPPPAPVDEYVTLQVSEGGLPQDYGDAPVIRIKRPTWEEVEEGRVLMDKFLEEFTRGWSVPASDGVPNDGAFRLKALEKVAASPDLVRIKQFMLNQGSLNKAVCSVISSWPYQKQTSRFSDVDHSDYIQLSTHISTVLVQICHLAAPELAYFYDHSQKWHTNPVRPA